MIFQIDSKIFQYNWDGYFKSNWHVMIEWLRRITKICIRSYGYSDHKFYTYMISNKNLKVMAGVFWNGMEQPAKDMVTHYKEMKAGIKRINQYKKSQT